MTRADLWLRLLEKALEQHHPDPVQVAGAAVAQYDALFPPVRVVQPYKAGPDIETVLEALHQNYGNRTKAGKALGISRWVLGRILKEHGKE